MTGFCRNMRHRPMKTVSEKYHQNPTKRRASAAVPPKQFMVEMLRLKFVMMMYFIA